MSIFESIALQLIFDTAVPRSSVKYFLRIIVRYFFSKFKCQIIFFVLFFDTSILRFSANEVLQLISRSFLPVLSGYFGAATPAGASYELRFGSSSTKSHSQRS